MNAMAFGGNYAFAGAPGNFRNGIMEKGYTAEDGLGSCKVGQPCDHGEVKGNLHRQPDRGQAAGPGHGRPRQPYGPAPRFVLA